MIELIPFLMFLLICLCLMSGYPVAFTLGGSALVFASIGIVTGHFDPNLLKALPDRLYGTMNNGTLIAVPLFIFMGMVLERSRIAEELLDSLSALFGNLRGGLGITVVLVGMLLAASTGIVGATVVTLGLIALPTLLRHGYHPAIASGLLCATGTLGQIIPPSIALVLLGDVLSSAYQQAQLSMGSLNTQTVSVGDLFVGALIPGFLLVALYIVFFMLLAVFKPALLPVYKEEKTANKTLSVSAILLSLLPPVLLIMTVLGSILAGAATPTEAAGIGATGALFLAFIKKQLSLRELFSVGQKSVEVTSMIFMILIGASLFSLVFRGFGGDHQVEAVFTQLPGGAFGAMLLVMAVIFLLGFILDFIEITFVVVPIVAPVLLAMGIDPVWLGIMIALNLQTSFLTPPFGFTLFYLRGVAPPSVTTAQIYRGV
ncbi:MAG: TRAP transporter large permease subunit, partial [Pseudomonadales bacterium]|nr:TRAP transporter large permease subunit [Pseudomonadales bacterium]